MEALTHTSARTLTHSILPGRAVQCEAHEGGTTPPTKCCDPGVPCKWNPNLDTPDYACITESVSRGRAEAAGGAGRLLLAVWNKTPGVCPSAFLACSALWCPTARTRRASPAPRLAAAWSAPTASQRTPPAATASATQEVRSAMRSAAVAVCASVVPGDLSRQTTDMPSSHHNHRNLQCRHDL